MTVARASSNLLDLLLESAPVMRELEFVNDSEDDGEKG